MKRVSLACLVAAALVFGHLGLDAAETARFRHVVSLYLDDKGGGLNRPEGVACDAKGQVVVADTGNDRLLRFTYLDKTVAGGTTVKIPELSAPSRVELNSKGDIYALDSMQRRIAHLGPTGAFKGAVTFEGAPSPATSVVKDFALDSADNVYALDVFSARVLVLDAQGKFQKALPLPNDIAFASALAVDAAGNVLLLDSIKRRLFSAAKDATAFAQVGGDLSQAVVTLPTFMTASKGNIFVVESASSIVSLGRDGSFLGRQLSMGWDEGSLNHPSQMCINDKDDVFIADRDNSRIQVFRLTR